MKLSKIAQAYRQDAGKMNNADGSSFPGVQNRFVGQARRNSNSFVGQTRNNADGSGMPGQTSNLPSSQNLYTAVLKNTKSTGDAVTCTIFGAFKYGATNDQIGGVNGTNGALVTIQQSSHAQARAQSISQPFWVNGLRYRTTTTLQMETQIVTIATDDSTGANSSQQFVPLNYFTAAQNQNLQADAPDFTFGVDGTVSVLVPVLPSETVTIVMKLGGRFNPQNALVAQSPIQVGSQTPLATGTTTVVLN